MSITALRERFSGEHEEPHRLYVVIGAAGSAETSVICALHRESAS
ncbi:hypothetical protein [Rhodococcus sp. T2V]|nr:hypothetical protein [Rhodococcus sp. T2V]